MAGTLLYTDTRITVQIGLAVDGIPGEGATVLVEAVVGAVATPEVATHTKDEGHIQGHHQGQDIHAEGTPDLTLAEGHSLILTEDHTRMILEDRTHMILEGHTHIIQDGLTHMTHEDQTHVIHRARVEISPTKRVIQADILRLLTIDLISD